MIEWLIKFLFFLLIFNIIWIVRLLLGFALLAKIAEKFGKDNFFFKIAVGIFATLDVTLNYEFTLLFLQPPASPTETITYRFIRYKKMKQHGWLDIYRYKMAVFFCNILNRMAKNVEPKGHC